MRRRRGASLSAGARGRPVEGARHVGVLVPWANQVVETELPAWAAGRVVWHYARLAPPGGGTALTAGFLAGMLDAVPEALHELSQLPLDKVFLACTSAAFTQQAAVKEATAGFPVPVMTAFDAILTGLARTGARTIALATPYPEDITTIEATAFEAAGVSVAATVSLGADDGYPDISPGQITDLIENIPTRNLAAVDAVVLSCTGWPTDAVLHRLRHRLTCPTISSNLAICTDALRTAT